MTQPWKKLEEISESDLTPMLRQYRQAKMESGEALLFFRMGDFYEMFFDDALAAAELLGITLTSRDAVAKDDRIPMAGVPVRSAESYIAKAIRAGRSVTICDQVEDPRQAKGIVRREIVRTITPGTVTEPDLLEERSNNYLAAALFYEGKAGLAFADVSTGELLTAQIRGNAERTVYDELVRMAPSEVLLPDDAAPEAKRSLESVCDGALVRTLPASDFDADYARRIVTDRYELSTLKGVGLERAPEALACCGAVLDYISQTQREALPHMRLPKRYYPADFVVIDGNTQRNLELVESLADKRKKGSLLGVLDRTLTSMGGRMMRHWLLHPLVDIEAIQERLDAVENLQERAETRLELREALRAVTDLERLLTRITARTGNARDLKSLGSSLLQAPCLKSCLTHADAPLLARLREDMDGLEDVAEWIESAIIDEPPVAVTEGGVIKDGFDAELDRLRSLVTDGKSWIATLQTAESEKTGIPNLKVGYNKVFGYYIEVTKAHSGKTPDHYERKQTLVNAERYITPELKEREAEIVGAQERLNDLEYEVFASLRERVASEARRIQETATAIATADALLSLAEVAASKDYVKPEVNSGGEVRVTDGRHPVVEALMPQGQFVPNDAVLGADGRRMLVVTGPNMAGKSTFLRQVALISLMAQIGSFVPAAKAQVGVVDRIFTRVGASDNLVRGESTFMVEMIETASILNSATERSLLILDEIGRGTSTFDGISIAWAVAEHIHDRIGAKTVFATHYHELTTLAANLEHAQNVNVAVREWGGKVVFLYRIIDGGADHSYGIQVAKLAGLPRRVITRAREVLQALESGDTAALGLPQQMDLFTAPKPEKPKPSRVERELEDVHPDDLSPREALDLVSYLLELLAEDRGGDKGDAG
jgi:DNA mismatch repair protein MutS